MTGSVNTTNARRDAALDGSRAAAEESRPELHDPLIGGHVMAVAYSGFREGQYPDRGHGAVNPSDQEMLEDLQLMAAEGIGLVRMYDAGDNTAATLRLIRQHKLPLQVLLGIWLEAEFSNHEGCPWLDAPIPDHELAANAAHNRAEVRNGIALAQRYDDIVVAINVGNEALVSWNDHMVPVDTIIAYVRQVRGATGQPVTVAENYAWWIESGAALAAELDFIGVHTYPAWEHKSIDDALAFTVENIDGVRAALPGRPLAILEAGWATVAEEFGDRASEASQVRYFRELEAWATDQRMTVFFFEAFDEPWKGDPNAPLGAEKHWGMWHVDRTPKAVVLDWRQRRHTRQAACNDTYP